MGEDLKRDINAKADKSFIELLNSINKSLKPTSIIIDLELMLRTGEFKEELQDLKNSITITTQIADKLIEMYQKKLSGTSTSPDN